MAATRLGLLGLFACLFVCLFVCLVVCAAATASGCLSLVMERSSRTTAVRTTMRHGL